MPEILGRLRPPRLNGAPSAPALGEMYYDNSTTPGKLYWWDSTQWVPAMDIGGATLNGEWRWNTGTSGDPGNGSLGIDTAAWATATALRFNKTTNLGVDASGLLLNKVSVGDILYLQQKDDATRWGRYSVKTAGVDNGTYVTIAVTWIKDGTAVPANNRPMTVIASFGGSGGGAGAAEVNISTGGPSPRVAELLWVDTDESPPAVTRDINMDTWHLVGNPGEPAFTNSWVNYATGQVPAAFTKGPDGRVTLRGAVKSGTMNTAIFTLPAGYRPAYTHQFAVTASTGTAEDPGIVEITTAGVVTVYYSSNLNLSLNNISFDTESVSAVTSVVAQPTEPWHTIGVAGEPAFNAGWSNVAGEGAFSYRKDAFGRVMIRGTANHPAIATAGTSSTAFTLPVGYRPLNMQRFIVMQTNGAAMLRIDTDGTVKLWNTTGLTGPASAGIVYIDTVEFDTDTVNNWTPATLPANVSPLDVWHSVGATGEPAFTNAWVNYAGGYQTAQFRKDQNGRVTLRGLIGSGTVSTGATGVAFTLPVGYRPAYHLLFDAWSGGTASRIDIDIDGTVKMYNGATPFSLDGIQFDTDTVQTVSSSVAQPMDTWHTVGSTGEPPFQNSWVNYDTTTYAAAGFRKTPDGRVSVKGLVKTGATSTVVFTLPVGYRPPRTVSFVAQVSGGTCQVMVQSDGSVLVNPPNTNGAPSTFTYLDVIDFDTESVSAYTTGLVQLSSPALVTVLPAAPVDGQEIYFLADAANGVVWHLRYRAASTSAYKWEYLGGPPLYNAVAATAVITTTTGAWSNLTGSAGPAITAPLAGDYDIEGAAMGTWGVSANANHGLSVLAAGSYWQIAQYTETSGAVFGGQQQMTGFARALAVPNGGAMTMVYANLGAGNSSTPSFANRVLTATPVRVG